MERILEGTSKYMPGMVYELSHDTRNQPAYRRDVLCVVVSSAIANSVTDGVLVAPIQEYKNDSDINKYRVTYNTTKDYTTVQYVIAVDKIFKASNKRLGKYRYSLLPDIMNTIKNNMMELFFGEKLYTRSEAYELVATREEVVHSNTINSIELGPSIEPYCIDENTNYFGNTRQLTREEEEYQFALAQEQHNAEIAIETTPNEEEKPKKTTSKKKAKKKVVKATNLYHVDLTYSRYASVYANWEEFVNDYTDMSIDDIMTKYNISERRKVYDVAKEIRRIAERNGIVMKERRRQVVSFDNSNNKYTGDKYRPIYDKWEDFLEDYSKLDMNAILDKYGIEDAYRARVIARMCKRKAITKGIDTSIYNRSRGVTKKKSKRT